MSDSSLAPAEPPKEVLVGGDAPERKQAQRKRQKWALAVSPTSTLPQQAGNGMPPANNQVQQPGIATVPPAAPTRQHSENTASLITSENLSGNGTAGAMSLQGQASPGVPGKHRTGMPSSSRQRNWPGTPNDASGDEPAAAAAIASTATNATTATATIACTATDANAAREAVHGYGEQRRRDDARPHATDESAVLLWCHGSQTATNESAAEESAAKAESGGCTGLFGKGEKAEFDRKPQIYTKFLDIMKNFKAHTVDTPGVIQQVSQLFRGHDALILGFNTFLPEEQRISLEQLKKMNKAEEEKKRQRKKAAQQRKAKKEKEKKQKAAMDAKARKNQKGTPGQPFGFDHAISYVTKIERRFAEKPATYREFLDILHLYKEQELQSIEGVS